MNGYDDDDAEHGPWSITTFSVRTFFPFLRYRRLTPIRTPSSLRSAYIHQHQIKIKGIDSTYQLPASSWTT